MVKLAGIRDTDRSHTMSQRRLCLSRNGVPTVAVGLNMLWGVITASHREEETQKKKQQSHEYAQGACRFVRMTKIPGSLCNKHDATVAPKVERKRVCSATMRSPAEPISISGFARSS